MRLAIEIDGSVHRRQVEADEIRRRELEGQGYKVIRFTNEQVEANLESVLSIIQSACQPNTPLPHAGEGLG